MVPTDRYIIILCQSVSNYHSLQATIKLVLADTGAGSFFSLTRIDLLYNLSYAVGILVNMRDPKTDSYLSCL